MDKYDRAVKFLTEHPELIRLAWHQFRGPSSPGKKLFGFAGPTGGNNPCGCVTQVKHGGQRAATPALTKAICADERIPTAYNITVEDLPVFAEWQRKLDKYAFRKKAAK